MHIWGFQESLLFFSKGTHFVVIAGDKIKTEKDIAGNHDVIINNYA